MGLRFVVLLLLLSLPQFGAVTFSQQYPPGVDAASQLRFGIGARALGMGSAFTAVAQGPEAVYWNPASLAGSLLSVGGMYTEPFGGGEELGYRVQFVGLAGSYEALGYGVGWFNSHVSDIPLTGDGGSFDYDSSVFFLSLALEEEKEGLSISVGGSLKVYREAMLEGRALGFGYDIGVLVDLGGVRLSYCSQDVGVTRYRWEGTGQEPVVFVPWIHRFGISAAFLEGMVLASIDLVWEPGELVSLSPRFGIEVSPVEWVSVRGGVRLDPFADGYHTVFTLGLGVSPWEKFRLDYAFLINPLPASDISTSTHVFSVEFEF